MIDVGVIGPYGIGPLSKKPLSIGTPFDPTVPPKEIKIIQLEHTVKPMITISWKASCYPVQQSYKVITFKIIFLPLILVKISYYINFKVNIFESNKNDNFELDVPNASDVEAKVNFATNYGGNYFIRVSTITPNAVPSPLINYRAPELPTPHQVKVFNTPEGHYQVIWHKPTLPNKLQKL